MLTLLTSKHSTLDLVQDIVIMANACDTCGYRSSDIKAGGGISEKGSNIILKVSEPEDLRRDVIKADTASISVPEADLEVTTGKQADTSAHVAERRERACSAS